MEHRITKIQISQSAIRRKKFPFDIVYCIPEGLKDWVEKLFPWALALPATPRLHRLVTELKIDSSYFLDDKARAVKSSYKPIAASRYTILVPIHPVYQREVSTKERHPGYLVAERHQGVVQKRFGHIFNAHTTLITPQGSIQPVCLACPRHLFHVQGRCALGDTICFQTLVLEVPKDEQLQSYDSDGNNSDTACISPTTNPA